MLWTGLNRGHEPREEQDMVDDVNHAVTGHDISCRHFGLTVHINTLGVFRDGELLFFQGRHSLQVTRILGSVLGSWGKYHAGRGKE